VGRTFLLGDVKCRPANFPLTILILKGRETLGQDHPRPARACENGREIVGD
jgi:hypothetical protein